jgi:hypothetical protein
LHAIQREREYEATSVVCILLEEDFVTKDESVYGNGDRTRKKKGEGRKSERIDGRYTRVERKKGERD